MTYIRRRPTMPRWTHIFFGLIWLATAFVFLGIARDARRMTQIKLARYTFRIPKEYQVQIGNVRFQDVINGIAEVQEKNTVTLEESLHESYHTAFVLNLVSAAAALFGSL